MDYKIAIRKINYKSLLILVLLLPFSIQWITYFIALWVLTWILECNFNSKYKKWKSWKFWLPISIILINIISILYSFDRATGFSKVQTQISLILLPLVFISVNRDYERKKNDIFLAYIIGVFLLSVFLFYNIIYLNRSLFSNNLNLNNVLAISNRFSSNYAHRSYLSLHVSLAIVFLFHLGNLYRKKLSVILIFIFLILVYSFVIIILNSRTALIVLILLVLYYSLKYLKNVRFWVKSIAILIVTVGSFFIIMQSRLSKNVEWFFQKTNEKNQGVNLYFNGNFENGLANWSQIAPDTIFHEIIDTEFGKAVRIHRNEGRAYYSLLYTGRDIIYYKDITYKFQFKFRIIKGEGIPFKIGWWVKENGVYQNDLVKKITPINNEWYKCEAEYTFVHDHRDLASFINSQLSNTIIDITDIELTSNDTLNRLKYIDHLEDIRISIWRSALLVIKEKPFFGYGIGDAKTRLLEILKVMNIEEAFNRKYNSHNQFLETAIQTGLFGLVVLLIVFAIPLYQSIKKKQELLYLFLMICFINFLFESMLERLAGVVFFAFWYSFLWFVYYKENSKNKENGE